MKIIQFQVCKPWLDNGDKCIFGLGDDGIVYVWYDNGLAAVKGWTPWTNTIVIQPT